MKYIILDDFEINNLQEKVNAYLEKGFKPIGGVSAVPQKDGFIEYLQAILKDED